MLKAPCYNCEDRHLGCHDDCNKYILYKQKQKLIKDQEARDRIAMAKTDGPRYNKRHRLP